MPQRVKAGGKELQSQGQASSCYHQVPLPLPHTSGCTLITFWSLFVPVLARFG